MLFLKKIISSFLPNSSILYARYLKNKKKPKQAIIDISAACNAKCPFCPRIYMPEGRKKGFMTRDIFEKCVEEIESQDIQDVRLYATSEPTVHPDFGFFIQKLKEIDRTVSVSTNGSFLNKHTNSLMLIDTLQLSIDGWDKDSYERLRYPLKFHKIQENVKNFYKIAAESNFRPEISAHLMLTKKANIEYFLDCWGAYVDKILVSFLMGTTVFEDGRFITKYPGNLQDDLYDFKEKNYKRCNYPFDTVTISFDGKISLCCADFSAELPLGYIEDGVKSVFNSPIIKKLRHRFLLGKPTLCGECNRFHEPLAEDVEDLKTKIEKINHPYKDKLVVCV